MWSTKKLTPICVAWGSERRRRCLCARRQSGKNRWAWLAINLCTAFIASRVIDGFEHTISQLVALASLMPIVAGIGGNTGNQPLP
ncbi:magnesium transporter [Citrobacter koseri]|nr:magnesium transporter [Citrobacter koseri]